MTEGDVWLFIKPKTEIISLKKKNPLGIDIIFYNPSENEIELTFRSGKKFDILLLDEERKELARWSHNKMFKQMLVKEVIGPFTSLKQAITWDLFKESIDKKINVGRYYLQAVAETIDNVFKSNESPIIFVEEW